MKMITLMAVLVLTINAHSKVETFHSSVLETARMNGHISAQTLIVKIKSNSNGLQKFGEFHPFFENETGLWGYLKLNMIPDSMSASLILEDLKSESDVLHAYFSPIAKNASIEKKTTKTMETTEATPSFEAKQFYLEAAPKGVGARDAWKIPGGTGKNVKIVDIETCYEDEHEDFKTPFYVGSNPRKCSSTDHGTAVWGEIAAKNDGKGVTGIAHDAKYGVYGFIEGDFDNVNDTYISHINEAIQGAIDHLDSGDVLVIEQQMIGPDLKKYTAVEYWPHIFEQLKAATDRGIICVEAAGNGNSNFDSAKYEGAFDLKIRDSGCIIVGAVAPNTRTRLSFSNYGKRVDAAGFGRGVTTTGYGDLFNGSKKRTYTEEFSGTSSATPIVAGPVAVVSSIAKEQGITIAPAEMRKALRNSGSPQSTSLKRVGNLPNITELLRRLKIKKSQM